MAREFMRSLGTIPYVANGVSRFELPRNHVYKGLILRLTGTVTVVDGGADGTLNAEQPQSLVQIARIIRNGSEVLQALDGGTLFALAKINSDGDPNRTPVAAAGAQVGTSFAVDIPIDFSSYRMINPAFTALRSVGASSLDLEIGWGSGNSFVYGSADTWTVNAGTQIEVFGLELLDLTGDFSDKILTPIQKDATTTQTDLTFDLPLGPLYRRLILKATGNSDGSLSDSFVNRVKVESDGVLVHVDRYSWAALQSHNRRLYSLGSNLSGYAVIDFCQDGNPAGLIDTRGASSFRVILDVTGAANQKIRVIQEQIIPARVA